VSVQFDFRNATIPALVGPLRATVVLGENFVTPTLGTCWQAEFAPQQCVAVPQSGSLSCR
jgi:hypothetical protein